MKKITKFQATDGAEFSSEKDCLKYEQVIEKVKKIMSPLGSLPKDPHCDFANGGGYIPHDIEVVERVKDELVQYGIKVLRLPKTVSFGWFGRYAGDSDNSPLSDAWNRLYCIDDEGREWGQPYYALNPSKGTQKPFNFKRK